MANLLEEEIKDMLSTKILVKKGPNCYLADDDKSLYVKTNKTLNARVILEGELESLKQIEATKTIRVPRQYFTIDDYDKQHNSAIIVEYLDLKSIESETAKTLGHDLANLHDYNNKLIRYNERASKWVGGVTPSAKTVIKHQFDLVENRKSESEVHAENEDDEDDGIKFSKHQIRFRNDESAKFSTKRATSTVYSEKFVPQPKTEAVHQFGFGIPTACGVIPQINHWTTDWVEFFSRYRIDEPIKLILSEHGDRELIEKWSQLQLKVDKFFTDFDKGKEERIIPSLLHGDLWSGNLAQIKDSSDDCSSEQPVIYDPSSFYGHSEYEFGISRMFGGIPETFEHAYFEYMPKKKLFEKRNKLYQLFHHLNHWNHFGFGYRNSSLKIMKDLNDMV